MELININSKIVPYESYKILMGNRGFRYGDSLFETIKVINSKILFWEDHYFRLMASMRIMRMEIPQSFSPNFLEDEILNLINKSSLGGKVVRVRFSVFRESNGYYEPIQNKISYTIEANRVNNDNKKNPYIVDIFKEYKINSDMLSTIKTNNKALQVIASIYKGENNLDNCIMINEKNNIVEAIDSNVFLVKGNEIFTPPISDGCIRGIMRKNIINLIKKSIRFKITEASLSPFEILRADELFLTNVIKGIQPVNKYRKVTFKTSVSEEIMDKLNSKLNIS